MLDGKHTTGNNKTRRHFRQKTTFPSGHTIKYGYFPTGDDSFSRSVTNLYVWSKNPFFKDAQKELPQEEKCALGLP